jgi:hypothetical protein
MVRLIFLIFLVGTATCKKEALEFDVLHIRSGTSFGFCVGYCERTLSLERDSATYTMNPTREAGLPSKECGLAVSSSDWIEAIALVDDAFFNLKEVYGCPDCRDQGSEWIEVITTSRSHKVTFDPTLEDIIHPLVVNQRKWRDRFESETPCQ